MAKRKVDPPDLKAFEAEADLEKRNRMLLDWLDDEHRSLLYKRINEGEGYLDIPSRDTGHRENEPFDLAAPRLPIDVRHGKVRIITNRAKIEEVLSDDGTRYSNRVYAELGGGNFMLALDPSVGPAICPAHKTQRAAYYECFPDNHDLILKLGHAACRAASVMAFKAAEFDLAAFAEQAAARFCEKLMGYSFADYPLLESQSRAAYRGLVHQVVGRHFTSNPLAIKGAKEALARLLARTSELIAAYATDDEDGLRGCEDPDLPAGMKPVLEQLAAFSGQLNGEQRAIVAVGAMVGTVGNVQAAACIAVKALFASDVLWAKARDLALSETGERETGKFGTWKELLEGLLRENPPIPMLPRWDIEAQGRGEMLLALGGGTQAGAPSGDDPLIWGMPPTGHHNCAGQPLAWPLIVEIVRLVMRLPGLAQGLDAEDASVIGLKKTWGFACDSYPLTYRRDRRVAQSCLNVAMRLRTPVKDSAARVREVIQAGAPRIDRVLRDSGHVHFAWFELTEGDSVLVLHTVYDGPFSAYVQHFALKAGDLFDEIFKYIENAPPTPVDKFPDEFVAHIRRFDRTPLSGYFYSAYPEQDTARVVRHAVTRP